MGCIAVGFTPTCDFSLYINLLILHILLRPYLWGLSSKIFINFALENSILKRSPASGDKTKLWFEIPNTE